MERASRYSVGARRWRGVLYRWLEGDQALGRAIHFIGVVLYAVAIVGGWLLLRGSRSSETDPLSIPAGTHLR